MNAIVTGASRGLGLSISRMLASRGYNLFLIANNQDRLNILKSQIEKDFDSKITVYSCDLSNGSETSKLVDNLKESINSVDIIVNNVGAFEIGNLSDTPFDQVERLLKINFEAAFKITQAYLVDFKRKGAGNIFNIGSIVTEFPRKDIAAYTISKFALQGYTKMLCDDLKDHGVKVTEVIPGSINTSSWDGLDVPKEDFIQTKDIVDVIEMVINSSKGVNFEQLIIRPTNRNF
jgi:short-subunit dehydrogenase